MTLPWLPEKELRDSLAYQVQEFIPIPVEDAELDFHRLDEYQGESDARMQRLLLVAAHRDMVASHVAAAQEAGLRPVGVDLNSFAVLRALVGEQAVSEGSEVLVDVGGGVTNIVVHENGVPRFVRILVLGSGDITQALASGLGIPVDEAEATKQQQGLTGGDHPGARIIEERATQFVEEVRGSLDYYQAQTGSIRINRVLLAGGGSLLAGLPERLAGVLRLPVEIGRPLDRLPVKGTDYSRDQLATVEPMLTTAIGLALEGGDVARFARGYPVVFGLAWVSLVLAGHGMVGHRLLEHLADQDAAGFQGTTPDQVQAVAIDTGTTGSPATAAAASVRRATFP